MHVIKCHVLEASGKISDDGLVTCVFSLSYGSGFHLRLLIGWVFLLCQVNSAWKFSSDPVTLPLVATSIVSKI